MHGFYFWEYENTIFIFDILNFLIIYGLPRQWVAQGWKGSSSKNFFLAEKANWHRKVKIMYNYVDGDLSLILLLSLLLLLLATCFKLWKLATMNPSGWHPPHIDNTDTLCLGDHHCLVRKFFFLFFFFVFPSVPVCQLLTNINGSVIYVVKTRFRVKILQKFLFQTFYESS